LTREQDYISVIFFILNVKPLGGRRQVMAEEKKTAKPKKLVVKRKRETVRERAEKSSVKARKQPRTRKIASSAVKPVKKVGSVLVKEYHPIKPGKSKASKALTKKAHLMPRYFIDAFKELRLVTWPSRKTVAKLTFAVVVFCVFTASVVRAMDYGFDKLFKDVILK
jgi:preprotein translocase SecE subunit